MSAYFIYPKQSKFSRIVAKNKIYEHAKPGKKVQDNFISQVARIVWQYKLAPKTTNLAETKTVKEVEIFEVALKTQDFDINILKAIDKTIVHPIIFHLTCNGKVKVIATYKRPNEADKSKWVVADQYFSTEWLAEGTEARPLPVTLNLASLYEEILKKLLPIKGNKEETLVEQVERTEALVSKEKEYTKLEARTNKEKQFNRRVEMNTQLRELNIELEELKHGKGK